MTEAQLQADIRLALGAAAHARLFRNQVGEAWQGEIVQQSKQLVTLQHYRRIPFGLTPSSGDLIGWTTVTVTREMVGQPLAVFTSGEVKRSDITKLPEDQQRWHDAVLAAGGRAAMLRSIEDGFALIRVAG